MTDDPSKKPIPHGDGDELAQADDAVIGRAFRWSILTLALLAAGAIGGVIYFKRKPAAGPGTQTPLTAPATARRAEVM